MAGSKMMVPVASGSANAIAGIMPPVAESTGGEPALPTLEAIARLRPLDRYDRPTHEVIGEVNAAIEAAGIEFGEGPFHCDERFAPDAPREFGQERWVEVSSVRGGSEGWYVHIRIVVRNRRTHVDDTHLVSTAKTWTRASALAIAAAATVLLDA